jgi:hypothetical protein
MTTLWTCPSPDCPPSESAPLEGADRLPSPYLTTGKVAELFGVSINRLYKLIQSGKGPAYYRVGKSIYYRGSDLLGHDGEQRALCASECGRIYRRDAFKEVDFPPPDEDLQL